MQADRRLSRAESLIDIRTHFGRQVAGVDRGAQVVHGGEVVASVRGEDAEPGPRTRVQLRLRITLLGDSREHRLGLAEVAMQPQLELGVGDAQRALDGARYELARLQVRGANAKTPGDDAKRRWGRGALALLDSRQVGVRSSGGSKFARRQPALKPQAADALADSLPLLRVLHRARMLKSEPCLRQPMPLPERQHGPSSGGRRWPDMRGDIIWP